MCSVLIYNYSDDDIRVLLEIMNNVYLSLSGFSLLSFDNSLSFMDNLLLSRLCNFLHYEVHNYPIDFSSKFFNEYHNRLREQLILE